MIAFARFVMRDNGLAIHINAEQVTQVRQTTEGEPAIYTLGRDTPMIVEGTLEATIRKLEAAAAGIRIVETTVEPIVEEPEVRTPALELVAPEIAPEPEVAAEPTPEPEIAKAAKAKPTKTKAPAKAKTQKTKSEKIETTAPMDEEPPFPTATWFKGNR